MGELVFVGTSDAFGAGGRRQSSILVDYDHGMLLLDCAPTTGTGLASLGVARNAIDAIAISHFHADHFSGIPQFLLASNFEDPRERPLEVIGPPGIEDRVFALASAMGHELRRTLRYPLRFREWPQGEGVRAPLEVGPVEITTFGTRHQEDTRPHAISLRFGGTRLVYSGDTGWFDELPERVGDADLFVCECNFYDRSFDFHLDYLTLREHFDAFRCKRIVLTHFSEEMSGRRGQLEVETADDGMRVAL